MPARHLTRNFPVASLHHSAAAHKAGRHLSSVTLARLVTALLLALPAPSLGVITFERAWPFFNRNCLGLTAQQTVDGGYIIGAYVSSALYSYDAALIRTDSLGDTLWTLVRQMWHDGYTCRASNGDFVLAGDSTAPPSGVPIGVSVARLDSAGRLLWARTYPQCTESPSGIVATADNGVVVVTGRRAHLLKLDSLGALCWLVTYPAPGEYYSIGLSVAQTSDSGYIVTGYMVDDTARDMHLYVVRTESDGELKWNRVYYTWKDLQFVGGIGVAQTPDRGYIITGLALDTADYRTMLVKLNPDGDIEWCRTYDFFWDPFCVKVTRDYGFVVSGRYGWAAGLMKTNSVGDTLWTRKHMPPFGHHVWAAWVEQTADEGYVLAGGIDYVYVYLVKTDSLGMVEVGLAEEPGSAPATRGIQVSPNPCVGKANIVVPGRETEPFSLEVHDAAGRLVRTLTATCQSNGIRMAVWDCTDKAGRPVPTGVYLVRAANRRQAPTEARLVLVR